MLDGFPDNVVACRATGRITKHDYEDVLVPHVDAAMRRHKKVRCYYEIGSDFAGFDAGAAWEDLKVGVEYITRWERVAVVTDVEWLRNATTAFRFLMPTLFKLFSIREATEAARWISETI